MAPLVGPWAWENVDGTYTVVSFEFPIGPVQYFVVNSAGKDRWVRLAKRQRDVVMSFTPLPIAGSVIFPDFWVWIFLASVAAYLAVMFLFHLRFHRILADDQVTGAVPTPPNALPQLGWFDRFTVNYVQATPAATRIGLPLFSAGFFALVMFFLYLSNTQGGPPFPSEATWVVVFFGVWPILAAVVEYRSRYLRRRYARLFDDVARKL